MTRTELTGVIGSEVRARRGALLTVAQLTDLHFTDVESPARFEFLNRFAGDPRFRELLVMQRPQEALNAQAIDAMVRAVNAIEAGPVAGAPVDLVAMTGDAIDNAQQNELSTFEAIFAGGMVSTGSGAPELESVQAPSWPDDIFWKPDGSAYNRDQFRIRYGFPNHPGVLDRAQRPFLAAGLRTPWIGCRGNHELLCQGVGVVTPELALSLVGGKKPIGVPEGIDPDKALELFTAHPEAFMTGASVAVTPDAARRAAHLAEPRFRVHDTAAVRLIVLDTSCPAGGADGRIDGPQLAWLEQRLAEAHAAYTDGSGQTVRTSNPNRLVVILSHHPLSTLRNERAPGGSGGAQLLALLGRFPNVVLWLNGHVHLNRVRPHANREGVSVGFWEVTTSSIVDWPCQGRLVELFDAGGGRLAIACTMIDHDGAVDPGDAMTPAEMAGLHRELAFNDPLSGAAARAGTASDRNVILALPAPFPL